MISKIYQFEIEGQVVYNFFFSKYQKAILIKYVMFSQSSYSRKGVKLISFITLQRIHKNSLCFVFLTTTIDRL